jgi:ferredoxin
MRMAKIIFKKSDVELEWDGSEESILELAEANDLDLDYGCRMGNCTACQQPVLSGAVEYLSGHTGEPDAGCELLCCCQPKGDDDLVIDA